MYRPALFVALALSPTPSLAALPSPVRAMIDAAIETGDPKQVETVVTLAAKTNPDDSAEIAAIHKAWQDERKKLAVRKAQREEQAIRTAGMFDRWGGKGEIGAFRSTGNSSTSGITAALSLTRTGIDWRHKLRAAVDYQRSNGRTTREQYLFAYQPEYRLSKRMFLYALGQYERDRFQGFSSRISLSGGLGYQVIAEKDMRLSFKGGPAYRRTRLIPSGQENRLAGLAALDFDWKITERLKLTEDASAFVQQGNSSFISATGLEVDVVSDLKARLSYTVEHDTDPPVGAVKTDTLSRFTLIYDF